MLAFNEICILLEFHCKLLADISVGFITDQLQLMDLQLDVFDKTGLRDLGTLEQILSSPWRCPPQSGAVHSKQL